MNNNLVKIRIRQIYAGLRPSEQKVADYILQYEGKASRLLMETVAQETGVSQPTVIRFVKAAGYEGFKDFKCALVQEEAKEQPEDSGKAGLYGFPLSRKDRLEDIPGKIVTTSVEMLALAKKAGGSFKTVNDRIHITKRFSEHLRALNIQIQRVEQIKVRHIECYIEERLELDIGLRTLQNEMAALRAVLRQAGRRQVMEKARTQDAGLAAALEIARLMGLRSQEAVQSSQSLKTWLNAVKPG